MYVIILQKEHIYIKKKSHMWSDLDESTIEYIHHWWWYKWRELFKPILYKMYMVFILFSYKISKYTIFRLDLIFLFCCFVFHFANKKSLFQSILCILIIFDAMNKKKKDKIRMLFKAVIPLRVVYFILVLHKDKLKFWNFSSNTTQDRCYRYNIMW